MALDKSLHLRVQETSIQIVTDAGSDNEATDEKYYFSAAGRSTSIASGLSESESGAARSPTSSSSESSLGASEELPSSRLDNPTAVTLHVDVEGTAISISAELEDSDDDSASVSSQDSLSDIDFANLRPRGPSKLPVYSVPPKDPRKEAAQKKAKKEAEMKAKAEQKAKKEAEKKAAKAAKSKS